jgi:hypothetical protein
MQNCKNQHFKKNKNKEEKGARENEREKKSTPWRG